MHIIKKVLSVLLAAVVLICTCGCGDGYMKSYIYFELMSTPETLDAQTAHTDSELIIVRNIYEGLLRHDQNGDIVCGAAKEYSFEDMTYTFKLRDDIFWSNGEAVTAHDFVFALRRAVDPKTQAPFASRLFSISGAREINSGAAATDTLAAVAHDDSTLSITLCEIDSGFEETLTTSVCMPCNEKFFDESIGKYGLDREYVISNGSYVLTKWNREEFGVRLYRNEDYTGNFTAQNAAVFISCIDDEKQTERLLSGESDMAFIPCNELETAEKEQLTVSAVQNTCWVMTVSDQYSPEVRKALAMAFSTDTYKDALPKGFTPAVSLYPKVLQSGDVDGVGLTPYDIENAKSIMTEQISAMEDKKFPTSTLYYYDTDGIKTVVTGIVGHWQQNLSTFINIEAADSLDSLKAELTARTLPFAVFPITVSSGSVSEYMINFGIDSDETPAELQQQLLSGNTLFPVAFEDTNISYIPTLENVRAELNNGYIDFSYIIKHK